jgi:hypothetical protein
MTSIATAASVTALAAQVAQLAERREEFADLEQRFEDKERLFYDTLKEETAEIALFKQEIATLELSIKAAAVRVYGEIGETKPTLGVTVKLFDTIDYRREDAESWSKEKGLFRVPEMLDVKAFEKAASSMNLPFVHETVLPKAVIASDLAKALGTVQVVQVSA